MTEGLGLHGLSLLANDDIAQYHRELSRPFIDEVGAAVLHIDHVVKERSNRSRYPIGAGHKLAAVDVAFMLETVTPFARGRSGNSKVIIAKDRPGYLQGIAHGKLIGYMMIEAGPTDTAEGAVTITVIPTQAS